MATPIYYLADTTKEWNLKLLKLPTNGEYNLFGDTYSYTDGTNKTNLSLGITISRNITGSYNLSLGPNVCSVLTTGSYNTAVGSSALNKITTMSRNLALGSDSLNNLSILASGLASVTLTSAGNFVYNVSGTYSYLVTATGPYTTLPIVQYTYTATFTSQSGWTGNIQSVLLTYSGTGFTSSTTFTFTPVVLVPFTTSASSVSYAYNNPNTGNDNLAIGYQSLYSDLTSTLNMAIGNYSLYYLNQTTTVSSATLTNDSINNIAIGYRSQYGSVKGTNNISLGNNSLAGLISSGSAYAPSNIICIGNNALASITTNGSNSIVIGNSSMTASISNAATTNNICIGNSSMTRCNGGYENVCIGNNSGISITTGFDNVIIGSSILTSTGGTGLTGSSNTFINCNTTNTTSGSYNFVGGNLAGQQLNTGIGNTLIGRNAGANVGGGNNNVALGTNALYLAYGTNQDNVAIGTNAGYYISDTNSYNVCIGPYAGEYQYGSQNVCIGYFGGRGSSGSLATGTNNVCIGTNSGRNLTTGANNTLIGTVSSASSVLITSGSNVTTLGYLAAPTTATVSNQITLGNSSVTTLRCQQTSITALSDARDKKNIIDLPVGLDFINKLRPVKFTWAMREKDFDENGDEIINPHNGVDNAGFIAQELDEVETSENVDFLHLVLKDNPDKLEASYGKLLPVMVKAIQDLSAKVDSLSQELAALKASK
jgi:hypothetical protein